MLYGEDGALSNEEEARAEIDALLAQVGGRGANAGNVNIPAQPGVVMPEPSSLLYPHPL